MSSSAAASDSYWGGEGEAARKVGVLKLLPPTSLALFLMSSTLKGQAWLQWLPMDITLLSAMPVLLLVVARFSLDGLSIPWRLGPMLLLLASFIPTFLWGNWTDYAALKSSRLYSLTLLAVCGPHFLIRDKKDLRAFVCTLAVFAAMVSLDVFAAVAAGHDRGTRNIDYSGALSAEDMYTGTIAAGRAASLLSLWVFACWITRRFSHLWAVFLLGAAVLASVTTGSRGPLLGTVVALASLVVLVHGKELLRYSVHVIIAAAVMFVAYVFGDSLSDTATSRIAEAARMKTDDSIEDRLWMWSLTFRRIITCPQGAGLGAFADLSGSLRPASEARRALNTSRARGYTVIREYPHNILLETFYEGGWLAGGILCYVGWMSWSRSLQLARSQSSDPVYQACFAILVAAVLWTMFSGDLNDNRLSLAILSLGLALPEPISDPRGPLVTVDAPDLECDE